MGSYWIEHFSCSSLGRSANSAGMSKFPRSSESPLRPAAAPPPAPPIRPAGMPPVISSTISLGGSPNVCICNQGGKSVKSPEASYKMDTKQARYSVANSIVESMHDTSR